MTEAPESTICGKPEEKPFGGASERSCNGWNYHVYCLGSDRCTMCGAKR